MSWDEKRIADLLALLIARGRDTTEVEVKSAAGGLPDLAATLCAFGNMPGGGTIVLGLDEATGFKPSGLKDLVALEEGVASLARNRVVPPVQVSFHEAEVGDGVIVIVDVSPVQSAYRPCRVGGVAYLRQADGDYAMSEQEVQLMYALRERPRDDRRPVDGTTVGDLDPDLVEPFVAAARRSSRRLAEEPSDMVLRRKGVVSPDGERLTVAGLYAMGRYPQEFLPSLSVTAAVVLGRQAEGRTADLQHMDGPLPDLLERSLDWVERNTRTVVSFGSDGHGRDVAEIPMVAVRELIANALVHRSLSPHAMGKRVEIRLRDDELVIASPGGLYGVHLDQLGTPEGKSAVNESLYDICKLVRTSNGMRVIEGEGGGIRAVRESLAQAGMRLPRFTDKGVSFTAFGPRHALLAVEDIEWLTAHPAAEALSDLQKQLLVALRHGQVLSNRLVRDEYGPIDSVKARTELQGLVGAGFVVVDGERGSARYQIRPEFLADEPAGQRIVVRTPRTDAPSEQDALPLDEAPADLTDNQRAVLACLDAKPAMLAELVERVDLSQNQVRYALKGLLDMQLVEMDGGWGVKGTRYRKRERA